MARLYDKDKSAVYIWTTRVAAIIASLILLRLIYIVSMISVLACIGSAGHDQASMIPLARAQLHSRNGLVRQLAAQALGTIGPEAITTVPELLANLRHDSPNVAADSACALGVIFDARGSNAKVNDKEVIAALTQALDHPDGEVRRYAAYAISLIGPRSQSAAPKLIQRLSDPYMGYMAARALGELEPRLGQ
jgi:HEAT repeat protein